LLCLAPDALELNAIAAVTLASDDLGGGKGNMIGTFFGALLLTAIFSGIAGIGLTAAWQLLTKRIIRCASLRRD
jgi:ribose/xylose/arabinose/galactoside ABC-type transport system permease subunit